MSAAPHVEFPLIDQLARLIERTYGVDKSLIPVGRFVVGDQGHALLTGNGDGRSLSPHLGEGAKMILRSDPESDQWAAALYLPNEMVALLERCDPRREIHDRNVDAFATLVEEIDHLIAFADRARRRSDVSLLELEWHACVTKYLVLGHFIGKMTRKDRLDDADRAFVEHHLFHKCEFTDADLDVRKRYTRATKLAVRFVRDLQTRDAAERIERLRGFHRASHHEKLRSYDPDVC